MGHKVLPQDGLDFLRTVPAKVTSFKQRDVRSCGTPGGAPGFPGEAFDMRISTKACRTTIRDDAKRLRTQNDIARFRYNEPEEPRSERTREVSGVRPNPLTSRVRSVRGSFGLSLDRARLLVILHLC
jgi:hypothetical protein